MKGQLMHHGRLVDKYAIRIIGVCLFVADYKLSTWQQESDAYTFLPLGCARSYTLGLKA